MPRGARARIGRSGGGWPPALPAAAAVVAVLLLVGHRYGPHGDELYFRILPLDWWYEDQPPLTVWLTHAMAEISGSLTVQRLPAALAAGAGAFLASWFPKAQGHGRRVQALAAWAHATTVFPLVMGHLFLTATLDLLVWQGVVLLVVRAVLGHPSSLAWAGAVAGIGCWNKLLVVPLALALAVSLLLRRRDLLFSRWAALGALAAVVLALPQVLAQAVHGWPMSAVAVDLVARHGETQRWLVLPLLAVFVGPPYVGVCWRGLRWTGARDGGRDGDVPGTDAPGTAPGRGVADGPGLLLPAGALLVLWNLASPAQPYYAVGLFLCAVSLGWGATLEAGRRQIRTMGAGTDGRSGTVARLRAPVRHGAVDRPGPAGRRWAGAQRWVGTRRWAGTRHWAVGRRPRIVVAANALVCAVLVLPLVPASPPALPVLGTINPTLAAQEGWPERAAEVDRARGGDDVAVVTDSYALAGAVAYYGAADGTRIPVASGHNALWRSGPPREQDVLLVGTRAAEQRGLFQTCTDEGRLPAADPDPYGVGGAPLVRCHGVRGGWAQAWPAFRHLGG